jgi:hypothetical protein
VVLKFFAMGQFKIGFHDPSHQIPDNLPIIFEDEETEKAIGEGLAAYEKGEYITVDPSKPGAIKKALRTTEI